MTEEQYTNLRDKRGLVAFSKRGRAALEPSEDHDTAYFTWNKLSADEQGAVLKANAAAAIGDWRTAERTLAASGFATGIR